MFCKKCGKQLNDSDVFCNSCGATVKEQNTQNTVQSQGNAEQGGQSFYSGAQLADTVKNFAASKSVFFFGSMISAITVFIMMFCNWLVLKPLAAMGSASIGGVTIKSAFSIFNLQDIMNLVKSVVNSSEIGNSAKAVINNINFTITLFVIFQIVCMALYALYVFLTITNHKLRFFAGTAANMMFLFIFALIFIVMIYANAEAKKSMGDEIDVELFGLTAAPIIAFILVLVNQFFLMKKTALEDPDREQAVLNSEFCVAGASYMGILAAVPFIMPAVTKKPNSPYIQYHAKRGIQFCAVHIISLVVAILGFSIKFKQKVTTEVWGQEIVQTVKNPSGFLMTIGIILVFASILFSLYGIWKAASGKIPTVTNYAAANAYNANAFTPNNAARWFCPQCGEANAGDGSFCQKCGSKKA